MKKSDVIFELRNALSLKALTLEGELNDIKDALSQDSKSTAGDKHETSRAMAQLEQEKLGKQLGDALFMYQRLESFEEKNVHEKIQQGSLVQTSNGWFFIGIPFGQLALNKETVFCLSPISPLGQLLLNKKALESVVLNGLLIEIFCVK